MSVWNLRVYQLHYKKSYMCMLLIFQNFGIVAEIYINWREIHVHYKIKLVLHKKIPGIGNCHLQKFLTIPN